MKVGLALNMLTKEGIPDAAVLAEHLALGDLAEPLGFDSLTDRGMPALQHDPAFAQPASSAPSGAAPAGQPSDGIFAPA